MLAVATGAAGCSSSDRADGPQKVTGPTTGSGFSGAALPPGVRLPRFRLRDQDGRAVDSRALVGRPLVVTFLYTPTNQASLLTALQVKGALDDVPAPVRAIAISVRPESDTPRSARRFLAAAGMTGRMSFLVGSRRRLERVWRGFAIDPRDQRRARAARIVLVDRRGVQRVGFPLSQTTPERIAHDLRILVRR
jgi:protein SCO1/2